MPQHFGQWGHLYPGGTVDGWLDHIRTRMNADQVPMTVIALDDGEPIGTAALVEHDMETHRELSPWLGGVYVVPSERRRGVARALVRDVMERAAAFGVPVLYLYTNGAEGLYQKLDWRILSREPYMGQDVTIMTCRLEGAMATAGDLHDAVKRGDVARIQALLAENRALANAVSATDARGTYPLHVAAEVGQAEAARTLLAYGADVTLRDAENDSIALCWAAFFGRPEVVAVLLEGGSEASQRNKHGLTPLGCAVGGTQGKWKQFSNATAGDWQRAVDLIRSRGGVE